MPAHGNRVPTVAITSVSRVAKQPAFCAQQQIALTLWRTGFAGFEELMWN